MLMAILNTAELNEFSARIDILESKGHSIPFTIDRQEDGNFKVELQGNYTLKELRELDNLTEQ